ncbi:7 transmembrane receptor (Secretin family) [Nesidiocoris tenuis]|uniref:7 transmembrane receptor (Secretin family) n=1 Tax=Nesidiocoris tenuis TaxID=355587 RepID=A0ABN7B6S4_9HEMI|nr:7 transmembrane receptor (Secretin family) [Nesidiocoris tenuis]
MFFENGFPAQQKIIARFEENSPFPIAKLFFLVMHKERNSGLFSDLRSLMGTTLMTLLATTFMAQLIYVVGVGGVHESGMCLAISYSLQFLHLCLLCWLLVLCKDTLANLTADSALPAAMTRRQMCLKFALVSLWAWGGPAVQVFLSYYTGSHHALPSMFKTNCWFIEKKLYLLFYGFPAMVLLCTCACLMVRARVRLAYSLSLETRPKHRAKLSRAKKIQVGLCSKLTFLLLTMETCGLAYILTGHNMAWIGYNVLHSVQGLVMALCATCHSQVLSVYTRRHRRRRSSTRLLSKTSSLEDLDWSPLPSTV